MPSRRFAILFESIVMDFPAGHCVGSATLYIIFLKVMAPRLRNAVPPNITNYSTWTAISNAAIAIEESVSLDDNVLEGAFSRLSLNSPATTAQPSNPTSPFHYPAPKASTSQFGSSPTPAAQVAPALGPNDMEIDALQHRSNGRFNQRNNHNCSSGASRTKPLQQRDSMRLWSDSVISKLSMLSATIFRNRYADVPIEDDPFTHTINNLEVSTSSITPKFKITLNGHLVTALVLRFPNFDRPFELHTDGACTAGISVILCQRDPRNNRAYAVAYASRSLSPAERNYGVSEVEALAIVWGSKKFAPYLTFTKFTVVTDHHSLQFLNNSKSMDLRGRLARWTLLLQQHDFDIVYRPGSKNGGPDALSRHPVQRHPSSALLCALQPSDLAQAQATDPYCLDVRRRTLWRKEW